MAESQALPNPQDKPAGPGANFNLAEFVRSPGMRQLGGLLGVAAAVAVGVTLFMWSQAPGFQPLFTGLNAQDAAEVVEALNASGIEYKQDPATGALMVPAKSLHDVRMQMASQGLPRSAGVGLEMMQQEQGLGVSQFLENARYQHALETELARTITNLQPIRNARVHLAVPKRSAFARPTQNTSASVLVSMFPGRRLEQGQVDAIVHLVSSSIPHLEASRVSIVDESGRLLSSQQDGMGGLNPAELEYRETIENRLRSRIEQLLLPIMGPGRVSAQVSVDLDFSETEETRESYAPDGVLRSEQLSERRDAEAAAGGVPGAVTNRVPGEADGKGQGSDRLDREHTRNFELDRTVSHTRNSAGRLRRVSAAVLVDYLPKANAEGAVTPQPLSTEELDKIQSLVRDAVGFNAERGDTVSVQNFAFVEPEMGEMEAPPLWERPVVRDLGRQLLGSLALLVIAFLVLRPALKQVLKPPMQVSAMPQPALAGSPAGAYQANAGATGGGAAAEPEENIKTPKALKDLPTEKRLAAAREAVTEDPKRVAQLVKQWVGDE